MQLSPEVLTGVNQVIAHCFAAVGAMIAPVELEEADEDRPHSVITGTPPIWCTAGEMKPIMLERGNQNQLVGRSTNWTYGLQLCFG
jgi:hypothetical protein